MECRDPVNQNDFLYDFGEHFFEGWYSRAQMIGSTLAQAALNANFRYSNSLKEPYRTPFKVPLIGSTLGV